jgi:pimeloyl-ACP methyl ester carboxylesterase
MYLVSVILGGILWLIAHRVLSKRLQAMALMSAGLISAVIVAPVLGSYIDKQGLGGSRLSGVLGLVGAIALITIGATRLVRDAKTRWRKLLAIPIAFAIAQFLVLPVVPAVLATQAARPPLPGGTPADLGMSYENVAIEAADGTKLAAWYIESRNGAAILLRHGSGSTRASLLRHAAFLSGAGYGVLLTDARGHGNSGGRINEFGWHGRQDIPAALDYLEARPDVSGDIGILGLSMGGEEALVAAAGDERIAAVVAEGAGTSTYEDSIAKEAHPMARYINWTMYALTDVLSDASQPAGITDSIRLIAPRPVLLIAGEETVEKTVGPIYRDAGGPTTQLWMLPDTPHTGGLRHHPPDYKERVLSFFHGSLLHE